MKPIDERLAELWAQFRVTNPGTLYACDSGGYDCTSEVMLKTTEAGLELVFTRQSSKFDEKTQITRYEDIPIGRFVVTLTEIPI